ncbi:MAG TPA: glucose-6-phosphate dehydrogenase assembly protein OpcA [Nakamurella sp.]
MIIDLPSTTSSKINRAMLDLREQGGSVALSRVLTLVIVTEDGQSEDPIAAANAASFEHPCRVIVVARGAKRASPRMDAQIRVGGDAGASEVIVLRLYGSLVDHGASVVTPLLLADSAVVVWWPGEAPDLPAEDPIGILGDRRITDANSSKRPIAQLAKRRDTYRPGDTDIAWTRITRWRGLLASALDQPPHERVTEVTVSGSADSPSTDLLAAWLGLALRCPAKRVKAPTKAGFGVHSVTLQRRGGPITLVRPEGTTAQLTMANQPERAISLPRRTLRECLSEELRRLDADEVYAEVLTKGLPLVNASAPARSTTRARTAPKAAPAKPARTTRSRKTAVATPTDKPADAPARATRRRRTAPTAAKTAAATESAGTAAATEGAKTAAATEGAGTATATEGAGAAAHS